MCKRREKELRCLSRWRFKVFIMLGRKLFQFLSPAELQTFFKTPPDTHEDCLPHTIVAGKHSPSWQHGEDACAPSHAATAALPLAARAGASSCELLPQLLHRQVPAVRRGKCSGNGNRAWKAGGTKGEGQQKLALNHYWFHFQC